MKIVRDKISVDELKEMSKKMLGGIVKAVVDVEQEIMAVDAGMHVDEEGFLLEQGSEQENLWGINFHPDKVGSEAFIEFDSMINMRPSQGNRSRGVESEILRKKIRVITEKLVGPL